MTRRLSLRLRLTLLTGLLAAATLFLFALVFYLLLQANLLSATDVDLRGRADLVSAALDTADVSQGPADLGTTPELVELATPGIYVELITADGTVQATSRNFPEGRLPADLALIAAVRGGRSALTTVTTEGGDRLRLLITSIQSGVQSGSVLVVAESLEPLHRTLAQARTLLLLGGVLAVVLAIGGAAVLTNQALAPIARLTRVAAGVAATGHYHERVPLPRYADEIQQLALTINTLIATVENTLDQQRQLLADTSHELRSPLTVVLANLNLLRRDLEPDERELSITEATDEARRMRRLVNELLLLAESDRARAIAQAPVRLDVLVEESVASVARQAPTHTIQARVTSPVVVMGDEERLTQLMRNLLDNATRHTPPGTEVDVRLDTMNASARIAVADTGSGIPAEHLPHIWDRFYRVDKARSRVGGGTGLGLAIVKFIAEAHGGGVQVESRPERGTTFTIILPLARPIPQQSESATTTLPAP